MTSVLRRCLLGMTAAAMLFPQGGARSQGGLPEKMPAPAVSRPARAPTSTNGAKQQLPEQIAAPTPRPSPTGAERPPLPQPTARQERIAPEAATAPLPMTAPAPVGRPTVGKLIPPESPATPPAADQAERAGGAGPAEQPVRQKLIPPERAPVLSGKPDLPGTLIPDDGGEPAPASKAMPPEEVSCRSRLHKLGAAFEEGPRIEDPAGCVIGHPLAVTKLSPAVALQPEAVVTCEMAEAAAGFTIAVIAPAARTTFGEELVALSGTSGYVCRPRNGTNKLSEHAFGNAIDISRFVLSKGTVIDVAVTSDPRQASFLAAIRGAACGPFRTVLGPGSDADHATHLHLDLAPRRNDATYCR